MELVSKSDEKTRLQSQHYFKEEIRTLGVKAALVNEVAREAYKKLLPVSKAGVFELCEKLWQTGYLEETFIACHFSFQVRKKFESADLTLFRYWIDHYITNWASCDTFCNHTVGSFLDRYPESLPELKVWALSPNRWMRRASAVSLIVPAREGKFLNEILDIANILLHDKDDLVQKGYGWLLKVACKYHEEIVFEFVMKHKNSMPRTALRYAIEKMPPERKSAAMKK
jgi:3-methyladenine DNA glycosylase AlkD